MTDTPLPDAHGSPTSEPRLDSWKEIAAYLRRDIRTVQRWEKLEGLPIKRLQHGKLGSVYAFPSELDKWYQERQPRADGEGDQAENEVPALEGDAPAPGDYNEELDQSRISKFSTVWTALSALVIVIAVIFAGLHYYPGQPLLPSRTTKIRLFVRPFANPGGDAEQGEFSAGLTDEINNQLARLDPARLGVIAPTSSKLLASKTIPELAKLLKIQYVLEGSVRRSSNQVRIDVHLISASDETPIWADSYTEDLHDILRVQDEVAAAVAKQIRVTIPPVYGEGKTPSGSSKRMDPEAYEAYLAGRRAWANRDLRRSIAAYQKTLQKEPDYVPARAGLASALAVFGEVPNDGMPPHESAPKARDAARAALAADANNAEAQCVLGNLALSFEWDFPAAERAFQKALALEPNSPTAHQWYGEYLIVRNRIPEAQEETTRALDLDPLSPIFYAARAEVFYYARDYDAAVSQAKLTLEQTPNFLLARFWLGSAYREKKMYAQAIEQFSVAHSQAGDNPAMLMAYGHALAVSGDTAGAQRVLGQLRALANARYVPAVYFAGIYAGLGERDQAFAWLNKAYDERNDRLIYLAVDPIVDPLRGDPRFGELMKRLGLP
jgi:TolB-like protein/tetratricopeptide (TPR) repeat protein